MKTISHLITLGLLAGCVPSVFPIYSDEEIIFDPALLGAWTNEDSSEIYLVSQVAGRGYRVVMIEEDCERTTLEMHLAQIGGSKFVDISYADREPDVLSLQTHVMFRFEQVGSAVTLRTIDPKWLGEYLEENPHAIEHLTTPDDEIVFTARTPDLQAFQREHEETTDAWNDTVLRHLTDEAAEGLAAHFFLYRCS